MRFCETPFLGFCWWRAGRLSRRQNSELRTSSWVGWFGKLEPIILQPQVADGSLVAIPGHVQQLLEASIVLGLVCQCSFSMPDLSWRHFAMRDPVPVLLFPVPRHHKSRSRQPVWIMRKLLYLHRCKVLDGIWGRIPERFQELCADKRLDIVPLKAEQGSRLPRIQTGRQTQ